MYIDCSYSGKVCLCNVNLTTANSVYTCLNIVRVFLYFSTYSMDLLLHLKRDKHERGRKY